MAGSVGQLVLQPVALAWAQRAEMTDRWDCCCRPVIPVGIYGVRDSEGTRELGDVADADTAANPSSDRRTAAWRQRERIGHRQAVVAAKAKIVEDIDALSVDSRSEVPNVVGA